MPIPLIPLEDLPPSQNGSLRLVSLTSGAPRSSLAYPRAIAHFFDFCVVQGTSLYVAKLFSIVLVSFHARAISHTGKQAIPLLREAYDFSSAELFAASFAALALLYFVGMPLLTGRTLGLGLFGLQIRQDSGEPLTIRSLSLRMLGCAMTYSTAGLLCVIGLRKRDGRFVQDLISESKVVRE